MPGGCCSSVPSSSLRLLRRWSSGSEAAFAELGALLRLFASWSRVSGLHLRVDTSVVVWLGLGDLLMLQERLRAEVPESMGIRVRGHAGYLGVELGPGARQAQWGAVEAKLLPRVAEVFRSFRSLRARVHMFSVCVASLLFYKAKFSEAGPHLPQENRRATQRITGAPWMCYNTAAMAHLDRPGVGGYVPRLRDALQAHFVRAVASDQRALAEGAGLVKAALASEGAFLAPSLAGVRDELIVFRWHGALVEASLKYSELALDSERGLKRVVAARLRGENAAAGEAALWDTVRRRAAWWDAKRAEEVAKTVRGAMVSDAPEEIWCSLLRSFLHR